MAVDSKNHLDRATINQMGALPMLLPPIILIVQ
jgi:hypothetical protein